ncbi:hypothetical protein HGM15179_003740 [Zosterops borbonicus]|uniref:Uncharacterized protein n=1 Tax=Zosterops borbonicus TaxID=364589 RepID=A0A8K1LR92_9PASS|nr:hypothetical protein HGM15179_003740 [Zosterops borbonicus]
MTQVQHFALGLVEIHDVLIGSLLKLVQVCLDGNLSSCVNCTTQFHITNKPAGSLLVLTVCVIEKDIEEHQFQDRALRDTTCLMSPLEHQTIDYKSLSVSTQPIPYPLNSPLFQSMHLQSGDKNVMWNHDKGLTGV